MFYYLLFVLSTVIYTFLLFKRFKKYKYNAHEDYLYKLDKNLLLHTRIEANTLFLPDNFEDYDSLFLKTTLSFNFWSYIFKPSMDVEDTKHFFEYGAKGVRYLNISHQKNQILKLKLKNVTLASNEASIYGYKNSINLSKKILILAPHADDAEIAAFGLYKTAQNVTIVTTTAAEDGICNYCDIYNNDKTKQSLKKAQLRSFDALCVPLLGNIAIQNSLALGYFGSSLKWMYENKNEKAFSQIAGINSMENFRKVSHANLTLPLDIEPTYKAFLNDLKEIITQLKPDIILTPHPSIDSHPDHKYTTLTLMDALQCSDYKCKLLLYTNHLKLSETYPLGDMHSSVTLPPNKKDFSFDSLYSFKLDNDLQIDKLFALEAMHDLRDSLLSVSIKKSFAHLNKMVKRKITGKDKSYYKRAVRANELFFVLNSDNLESLLDI